jgi:acetoacetyl-[acyl-carrier protein] synthase
MIKKPLTVITGFGGINASGRSSDYIGYKNLIFDSLEEKEQLKVLKDLAVTQQKIKPAGKKWETNTGDSIQLNSYLKRNSDVIRENTLVREIERDVYDPEGIILDQIQASAAGQLPTGFDPGQFYSSRQHPKALQMTVFGMSDTLGQFGIDWSEILKKVSPDQIAVFSGAAIGNMDHFGFGGMMQSRMKGSRSSSKNLPFGLVEMSADFINAYILGNVGRTGHVVGACATFLFNLQLGKESIENGSARVVIVGGAEAPITPEIIDGFFAISALSDDKSMLELQSQLNEPSNKPNQRKACRPFGDNIGMVMGESAQFVILMDEDLALELGTKIYASVQAVASHADGFKSSISGPGVGNYITLAKCVAEASQQLGSKSLKNETYVHAHGTGTPANRTSESHILDEIAKVFGIKSWPVTAIKSYLGHSMAVAAGDQLTCVLGTWNKGIIPRIHSITETAEDVFDDNLNFLTKDKVEDPNFYKGAFLNAKGFGGNNASALILGPDFTFSQIKKRYTKKALKDYERKLENTRNSVLEYNENASKGAYNTIYKFNHEVLEGMHDLEITKEKIKLKGYKKSINLKS